MSASAVAGDCSVTVSARASTGGYDGRPLTLTVGSSCTLAEDGARAGFAGTGASVDPPVDPPDPPVDPDPPVTPTPDARPVVPDGAPDARPDAQPDARFWSCRHRRCFGRRSAENRPDGGDDDGFEDDDADGDGYADDQSSGGGGCQIGDDGTVGSAAPGSLVLMVVGLALGLRRRRLRPDRR